MIHYFLKAGNSRCNSFFDKKKLKLDFEMLIKIQSLVFPMLYFWLEIFYILFSDQPEVRDGRVHL